MECSCVRQTELPHTSKLFADLVYHFDRVQDLYPWRPNSLDAVAEASRFVFPDDRRAAIVRALTPLNQGNPSLQKLAAAGRCRDCYRPAGGTFLGSCLHSLQGAYCD